MKDFDFSYRTRGAINSLMALLNKGQAEVFIEVMSSVCLEVHEYAWRSFSRSAKCMLVDVFDQLEVEMIDHATRPELNTPAIDHETSEVCK